MPAHSWDTCCICEHAPRNRHTDPPEWGTKSSTSMRIPGGAPFPRVTILEPSKTAHTFASTGIRGGNRYRLSYGCEMFEKLSISTQADLIDSTTFSYPAHRLNSLVQLPPRYKTTCLITTPSRLGDTAPTSQFTGELLGWQGKSVSTHYVPSPQRSSCAYPS